MLDAPADFTGLCLLVFMLGARHGLDADHLAAVDGLTRQHLRQGVPMARWCGSLFSLGHGGVVMAVALVVSALAGQGSLPPWMERFGAWVSITVLLALGLANAMAVWSSPADEVVATVGLRARFLGRWAQVQRPWMVALVGALFAVSFDTLSQAALFALTATQFGGWAPALALGAVFTLGMLVTDGLNGLWMARLIQRADRRSRLMSRAMSLAVAGVSLLIAALGIARLHLPKGNQWLEEQSMMVGAAVLVVLGGSYLMAQWVTRAREAQAVVRQG